MADLHDSARAEAFRRFWKRGSVEFDLRRTRSERKQNPYASNVLGIGRGPGQKKGQPDAAKPDCIRFYVSSKPAPGLLDANHESFIPAAIGGVPTDVIEVGRVRSFTSSMSPGTLVTLPDTSTVAPSEFGVLGALVREKKNGGLGLITCNHVIAWNGHVPVGSPIHVATPDGLVRDERLAVATLANWIPLEHDADNLVDCAYATFPKDAAFTQTIGPEGDPRVGDTVSRFGESVSGKITDISATIDVDYEFGTFRLTNQIVIESDPAQARFATEGNSGSIVVRNAGNKQVPIAMVWGGRRNFTYASPLKTCLKQLDVTWVAPI